MNYMQQPMQNPKDILDPTTAIDMALVLMAKAFKLNNTTPTNNNQRSSSNPRNWQIAQPGMNMDQDRHMLMNVGNLLGHNAVQNSNIQKIANQSSNENVVAARAEGNGNENNENQIRCYNCQGVGHYAGNCTVRPKKRDASYLQTQLQIVQKEEAGIQLNYEVFDFMAAACSCEEIEEVNTNFTLKDNLQQASTSSTQTDSAPVYDLDGSSEVYHDENCYDNDIFNMFTQQEYMEHSGRPVEQQPATVEETRAFFESLYNNLVIEVEKVNTVNRKMKETNADLTIELARYKNHENCFEINQERYDKLERCYQKSVYQEQCLTKKINALHLSFAKQIMTVNEEILNINKQLSKEKLTVLFLREEKKKLKCDFKIRKDELLDKQIQIEKKIKELDNILVKTGKSIQTMHMLSPTPDSFYHTEHKMALGYQNSFYLKQDQQKKQCLYNGKMLLKKHDPPVVYDSAETLQLAQESSLKMKQLNKEIKPANYAKINHLSKIFVKAKSCEELYFSNTSKTASVSNTILKPISIPNEEFSDDTSLKATKFVQDFKSLTREAGASPDKHKALEFEIERLLRTVVSQDIMSIMQINSVVDTSNLQIELDRMKEKLETRIIKNKKEYVVLWNDWYKKCAECKYDKILYYKAYNDMQNQIERLQAHFGDLEGKNMDTQCASDTLDLVSQKLDDEIVSLEF
ncbi:retrovirus-related pol polyprotein from transposon TNT 1-94 [Tanacetum coccineum]|uniref:Retrovirus-related pol polyprotein from transposon TNT 1-94 n=1 Tax=Tanacetum coccineum TaxID=301880 RepID=A0ABQ5BPW1_9ASTR